MTRRSFFGSLALVLVVGGVGALGPACSKPEPPKLVPIEAKVTGVGPTGMNVLVRVEATNPNRITLSAQSFTGKAKLDGKWDMGTVTVSKPVSLAPSVPTMIDLPMTLPWSDMKAFTALAAAQGPLPYVIDGTVTVGGENIHVDVPFSVSGTVTRDQIMNAALKGLPTIPGLTLPAQP